MELEIHQSEGFVLVATEGPLDDEARNQFNDLLHPLATAAGSKLLIDLARTPRVTSNGLGALVSLVAWANAHGARVVLSSPTEFVMSVFKATRLDTYLNIAPSEEEGRRRVLAYRCGGI